MLADLSSATLALARGTSGASGARKMRISSSTPSMGARRLPRNICKDYRGVCQCQAARASCGGGRAQYAQRNTSGRRKLSITPQVGAISHAALPAHAIEGGPLARGPASGGESWSRRGDPSAQQARTPLFAGGMGETSPEHVLNWRPRRNDLIFPDTRASGGMQVAAVIDELQAEVRKLKDVVAELRAEVDELKVRGARDEKDIVWVMEEIRGQRPPHVNIPTSGG